MRFQHWERPAQPNHEGAQLLLRADRVKRLLESDRTRLWTTVQVAVELNENAVLVAAALMHLADERWARKVSTIEGRSFYIAERGHL